eukprot:gnl/Ergobibamus_cyprinoides/412.p1 GENE.gnl/Ergobibamus_cyprinoides/412~~gnl/Ergobibamus_cyprinoides/412.p1  ORF type:complete len:186 (+),score=33.42 gnl/Ergobibamus_cyprinoides/412:158-715(+)
MPRSPSLARPRWANSRRISVCPWSASWWNPTLKLHAKILRQVKFPAVLDLTEWSSPELKPDIVAWRQHEHAKLDAAQGVADTLVSGSDVSAAPSDAVTLRPSGAPSHCPSGQYELCGAIAHKGRSADAGHYVAYTKDESGHWALFDDETVIPVDEAEVLELSGGADTFIAVRLLYRSAVRPQAQD